MLENDLPSPPSTLWLFCFRISNSASSPWMPPCLCSAAAGGNAAKENAQKKFGTIPTRTFRHLRLYRPVEDGHHIEQQLKLTVRHLQTLFLPSRPPTTDCIWLNRSNYSKENKPEIEHPHLNPTHSSEALSGASALFLSPAGVSYMQV